MVPRRVIQPVREDLRPGKPNKGTMDERTRDVIDWTIFWVGVAMMLTGLIGEILGWWNDLGLVLTIGGFAATMVTLFDAHGRRAVDGIGDLKQGQSSMIDNQSSMIENQDRLADGQRGISSGVSELGQAIRRRQDATVHVLDRIEQLLDQRLPRSDR